MSINFPNFFTTFPPYFTQKLLPGTLGSQGKQKQLLKVFYKSSCSQICLENSQENTCGEVPF